MDMFTYIKANRHVATVTAQHIADALSTAIDIRGHATLMVSGGSSPKPVYSALSQIDLPWDKITIGLVDDRWVDPGSPGSNETFIKDTLLQNNAKKAAFIGLKRAHASPAAALSTLENDLSELPRPFDICIMGMGLDGHTASWFPGARGLEVAMDIYSSATVAAIDALGCPVAGNYTDRITLTLSAVMDARALLLFIPGQAKADVFAQSENQSEYEAPVKALRAAGKRLLVVTG